MENLLIESLPFSNLQGKYFIAIGVVESITENNFRFFERIYNVAGKNQVHIVVNGKDINQFGRLYTHFKNHKNFHVYNLNSEKPTGECSFDNIRTDSMRLLRQKYLECTAPYFLNIAGGVCAPRGLLNKFERAISFLEKNDPHWGVLGGLYHRGSSGESMGELKNRFHVLWGYTVYKRLLIEKYPFEMIPLSSSSFPFAWTNLDKIREFNCYEGHTMEFSGVEAAKTKPVIVKL